MLGNQVIVDVFPTTKMINYIAFDERDPLNLICPFCLEEDFDRIGLALHLRGWCDKFPNTEEIQEEFNRNKENGRK